MEMGFKDPHCSKYRLEQVGHARFTILVWTKINQLLDGHPLQETVVKLPTSSWCWYSYVGYTGHLGRESMCLWGNTKRKQIGLCTSQGQQKLSTQPWDECVKSSIASAGGKDRGRVMKHHAPLSFIPSPLLTQGKVLPLLIGPDLFDVTFPLRQSS